MDRCILPVTLSCFGQSFFSFPEPCNNWESLQAAHLRRDGGRKDNPPALMRLPTSTGRGATRPTRAGKSRSWRPSDEALHHAVTGDRFRELGCNLRTLPFTGGSIAGSRLLVRESKLQTRQELLAYERGIDLRDVGNDLEQGTGASMPEDLPLRSGADGQGGAAEIQRPTAASLPVSYAPLECSAVAGTLDGVVDNSGGG